MRQEEVCNFYADGRQIETVNVLFRLDISDSL